MLKKIFFLLCIFNSLIFSSQVVNLENKTRKESLEVTLIGTENWTLNLLLKKNVKTPINLPIGQKITQIKISEDPNPNAYEGVEDDKRNIVTFSECMGENNTIRILPNPGYGYNLKCSRSSKSSSSSSTSSSSSSSKTSPLPSSSSSSDESTSSSSISSNPTESILSSTSSSLPSSSVSSSSIAKKEDKYLPVLKENLAAIMPRELLPIISGYAEINEDQIAETTNHLRDVLLNPYWSKEKKLELIRAAIQNGADLNRKVKVPSYLTFYTYDPSFYPLDIAMGVGISTPIISLKIIKELLLSGASKFEGFGLTPLGDILRLKLDRTKSMPNEKDLLEAVESLIKNGVEIL